MPVPYNSMHTIDINCDLGEGFPNDAALMSYISSANIACGYHAGDTDTMKATIELCLKHHVAIGAHPGYDDKANFGRTDMTLSDCALYDLVAEQITLMQDTCKTMGANLHHVKPHGALYNMAAKNATMSRIIAEAIKAIDPTLILYGLTKSHLIAEAKQIGLRTADEVFADRTFMPDGQLTPRTHPDAMLTTLGGSFAQVLMIVQFKKTAAIDGSTIDVNADTVCIHGDGKNALDFAKKIYQELPNFNIRVKAFK
jgi:5-oxoprolinase (ATP-hydrolysing) subunit A